MSQTIQQWREANCQAHRAKIRAKNQAIKDLKEVGIEFDYLKPCPSDDYADGWERSRTTWNLMTGSIEAMYYKGGNPRVIELVTGHLYFLMTNK
jgi:hypothetical protein